MGRARVFLVDDSSVVRHMVSGWLAAEEDIEVVGSASNGHLALARLQDVFADLVILDVEMPGLDGLGTLKEIRKRWPDLPVVMFSALTERGGISTLEALSLGASDYLTKPSADKAGADPTAVRSALLAKVRGLAARQTCSLRRPTSEPTLVRASPPSREGRVSALAIGCSTGGPNALEKVLSTVPGDLPVPVFIVQHMPPVFTGLLAKRLDEKCPLAVREATAPMEARPGTAYVAPGNLHMVVGRKHGSVWVDTHDGPRENSCRPAVDVLFRSVEETYGGEVVAVVLTGMGKDGLSGVEGIVARGGQVVVQDEETSVVWGMPGFIARAGLADSVLPLDAIGPEITRRVLQGQARFARKQGA